MLFRSIGRNAKEEISKKMRDAYKNAQEFNANKQSKRREYFRDKNFKEFEVGNFVWLLDNYRRGKGSKLKPRYLGPYRVIDKYSPVNYTIKPLYDLHKRQEKVHINRLKRCHLPNIIHDPDREDKDNEIREEITDVESINSDSDDDIYIPMNINSNNNVRINHDRNDNNTSNTYNLRSKGPVIDTDRVLERPLEYRSNRNRNMISLIVVLIFIIKMFCYC